MYSTPGAGVTPYNFARVLEETGAGQIHVAVHRLRYDRSTENNRSIYYGGCLYPPEDRFQLIDRESIRGMSAALGRSVHE